jgi:hypothetical protein
VFPRGAVPVLQAMLAGEHEAFAILCILTDDLTDSSRETDPPRDYLALFSARMLVTRGLADPLSASPGR